LAQAKANVTALGHYFGYVNFPPQLCVNPHIPLSPRPVTIVTLSTST